jgi:hypothetical protein
MNPYEGLLPNEPILMPYQAHPLNGDHFACSEFLALRDKFGIKTLVELGSCVFGSTNWFADHFEKVITVEINEAFRQIGLQRAEGKKNIISYLGDSIQMLPTMLSECDDKTLIFIDSHWQTLPLIDELKIIKQSGIKPCIIVHDCFVPNEPYLGYDEYQGVTISLETMKPYLDDIYGSFSYHYNTSATATEVQRGIIYIYPETQA